ncbi:glycosyltransferase family 4 protein [Stieleria sp. JC731]|uniref:glycosyltransferase family 4 protein n=1 Tax=Pirellulaceae TaxID=2691357 RepID=UPI001E5AEEE9|nr:glycosyltransferase family 1 protein [Stieleria sp. JC731]MCC9599011.1 glycosyltransferase family 4 protein [Stieleria sp. JC731]
MRIAFWLLQDSIRQWAGWVAGLHYVRNCLEGLASLPNDSVPEVVAFVPTSLREKLLAGAAFSDSSWFRIHLIEDELLLDLSRRDELARRVNDEHCDLLFPAITPPAVPFDGKCVGWITDLQHKHYPEFFSAAELRHRDELFSFLSATCDRIVCSSAAVQTDMLRFFPEVEDRTFILRFRTHPPASAISGTPDSVMHELQIDEPYVYLPYQFWQHKNHRVVFEAWARLHQESKAPLLVCSGARVDGRNPEHFPSLEQLIESNRLADRIRILGMVPREQQWQLYRNSTFVIQPSLFEGWSTSVEEARSLGKTVLLSDIPVHREQTTSPDDIFEPHDADRLADLIKVRFQDAPTGYSPESERHAIEASTERLQDFGRDLVRLFESTMQCDRKPMSASVLPLLLSAQNEAAKRLEVIEHLKSQVESLNSAQLNSQPGHQASPPPRRRWFRRRQIRADQ